MSRPVRLALAVAVALVLALGATAWALAPAPALRAQGPVTVTGTEASGSFTMGSSTVRQVRYDDRGTLGYGFRLTNDGPGTARVTGVRTVGPLRRSCASARCTRPAAARWSWRRPARGRSSSASS